MSNLVYIPYGPGDYIWSLCNCDDCKLKPPIERLQRAKVHTCEVRIDSRGSLVDGASLGFEDCQWGTNGVEGLFLTKEAALRFMGSGELECVGRDVGTGIHIPFMPGSVAFARVIDRDVVKCRECGTVKARERCHIVEVVIRSLIANVSESAGKPCEVRCRYWGTDFRTFQRHGPFGAYATWQEAENGV